MIREARQQLLRLKTEGMASREEALLLRASDNQDASSGACLEKQALSVREEMGLHCKLLPSLVESMQMRAVVAGSIADRLEDALGTCNVSVRGTWSRLSSVHRARALCCPDRSES